MSYTTRSSFIVKAGRVYQSISPLFGPIDILYRKIAFNKPSANPPVIVLLAPPRSGSTLTYQLLTSAFKNFHLTNIWNLLYATPAIGAVISENKRKKNPISAFQSKRGFVPGLTGEAEGLKFWSYWIGQGLVQKTDVIKNKKFERFSGIISKLSGKLQKPFICGYLGHVFCVNELRKYFQNVLFIHLTRDLLSNACSIYKVAPNNYFSVLPNSVNLNAQDRYQQIAKQIISVHNTILKSRESDTFQISYEEICSNPNQFINEFSMFAKKRGVELQKINENILPSSFPVSYTRCSPKTNKSLLSELAKEIEKVNPSYQNELKKLISSNGGI